MFDKKYYLKQAERYNNLVGNLSNCKECKGKGNIAWVKNNEVVISPCKCVGGIAIKETMKRSKLNKQFEKQTLDSFKVGEKWQENVKRQVERFLNEAIDEWLYISGQSGSGKTHLVTALTSKYIANGRDIEYMSYSQDMTRLQSDLRNFNQEISQKAEKSFNYYKNVAVLVIDDFMKNRNLDFVFELINHRYINNLQTIITSELVLEEQMKVDEAIAGRIYEKAQKYYIKIEKDLDKNYRLKGARDE